MRTTNQTHPPIVITETDYVCLQKWVEGTELSETGEALSEELLRARVIPVEEAPETLVTMNSTVAFENLATGRQRELTLVYPHEADAERGRVSVLAPVGAALLGLTIGQEIAWPLPNGAQGRFRVTRILSQARAAAV